MDASISPDRIREASQTIDPVFLHTPQFTCEPLSARLGVTTVLKVESINPIRSFKGRGTDYLLHRLGAGDPTHKNNQEIVCASAGNFGQGMAYACRKARRSLTVFAARTANPLKVQRMRDLGADVHLDGDDFDEAKDAAKRHAREHKKLYVEDGHLGAIAEGAGTIALELLETEHDLDALFVPLGNGSLANGIGTWLKHGASSTRLIAVCAENAPSMELSWKAARPIAAPSTTIADGIAVRVPVPQAVELMRAAIDEVMLVTDQEMRDAMRWLFTDAGIASEPSAAAGVAAIAKRREQFGNKRVATVVTGGNLTEEQIREWLY
ncbi:MAG TPA: pyridoxal-phosphate dependent enzyme [Candidatus Sulfotelmatobacter sp.]|nr:pyridoxal-phosphate dependent enzyme [Candidatus Sulfotelmatobacter sp.]